MTLLAVRAMRYSSPLILTNPQIFGNKTCLLATILLVSVENADEADDKVLELAMKKMLKMLKKLKMLVI